MPKLDLDARREALAALLPDPVDDLASKVQVRVLLAFLRPEPRPIPVDETIRDVLSGPGWSDE